jgi:hypothetical protein
MIFRKNNFIKIKRKYIDKEILKYLLKTINENKKDKIKTIM